MVSSSRMFLQHLVAFYFMRSREVVISSVSLAENGLVRIRPPRSQRMLMELHPKKHVSSIPCRCLNFKDREYGKIRVLNAELVTTFDFYSN